MLIEEGKKAPEFTWRSSEGGEVSLKGLRGKTVVLYFYPKTTRRAASRAAPSATARPLKKKGVVVLGQ